MGRGKRNDEEGGKEDKEMSKQKNIGIGRDRKDKGAMGRQRKRGKGEKARGQEGVIRFPTHCRQYDVSKPPPPQNFTLLPSSPTAQCDRLFFVFKLKKK